MTFDRTNVKLVASRPGSCYALDGLRNLLCNLSADICRKVEDKLIDFLSFPRLFVPTSVCVYEHEFCRFGHDMLLLLVVAPSYISQLD